MKKSIGIRTIPWLLFASLTATAAHAAGNKVVIGDIDDMSGLYADVVGPGRRRGRQNGDRGFRRQRSRQQDRTADLGPPEQAGPRRAEISRMGRPRRTDHGARRIEHRRQHRDGDGRQGKEDAVLRDRRRRRVADRQGLHALHGALRLRHHRARQRHGDDHGEAGRQDLVLPDRRLRVRHPVAGSRREGRGGQWRQGDRRGARPAVDLGLLQLSAAGAEFRRAGAGPCQCRQRLHQLDQGGRRVRHRQDDEARGTARLHQRHPQPRAEDRPGPLFSPPAGIGISTTRPALSPSATSRRPSASRP